MINFKGEFTIQDIRLNTCTAMIVWDEQFATDQLERHMRETDSWWGRSFWLEYLERFNTITLKRTEKHPPDSPIQVEEMNVQFDTLTLRNP